VVSYLFGHLLLAAAWSLWTGWELVLHGGAILEVAMKLLVPVDFSPSSETVIAEIEARPWPAGTEALVLNVVDIMGTGSGVMDVGSILAMEREKSRQLVEAIAGRLSSAGVKATGDVIEAMPRTGISDYAKECAADFIILGSHGHSGLVRFLLGSVAKSVLRSASCSVEIVRAAPNNAGGHNAMRILLATDGSEYSRAAASSIASRPWLAGSQFKVVSFAEVPPFCLPPNASTDHDTTLDGLREDIIQAADDAVESAQSILKRRGLDSTGAATVGDPRTGILDDASKWGARLIVLGSHGSGGSQHMPPGGTAETVALHAHCSVEVIRGIEVES
jgi:nucleotide-binding universal stress UspA family protein